MYAIGHLLSVGQNWTREATETIRNHTSDEELRVSVIHDPPYFFIESQKDGSHRYDGYLYELWQVLAREAGVRYRIVPLLTSDFGRLDSNGSWSGLVGELAYGRADVGLSWLGVVPSRETVVDFLDAVPVSWFQDAFYVRSSPSDVLRISSRTFESLLKPLHSDVWWTLLASMLVLSVGLRVTLRFNHAGAESRRMADGMTWGSCLLNSFLSVVGQGWATTPDSLAARTVTISSWVLGILLHASYTANLMSHLTVAPTGRAIHSLQEFFEHHDWKFAMDGGESVVHKCPVSRDEYERELFRRFDRKDRFIELRPGNWPPFEQTDSILMRTDMWRLQYVYGQDSCRLTTMLDGPAEPPKPTHIGVAKGRGTLREDLNRALMAVSEAGVVLRLKRRWLRDSQLACHGNAEIKPLSFSSLLAMLLIVPLAVVSSVAILAVECLWSRSQQSLGRRFTIAGQVSGIRSWSI